jgi:hypothetical protein
MVAAYAIRTLSRITSIPLGVILAQVRPAATSGFLMAAGILVLDRFLVHAGESNGATGASLLALDLLGAVLLYFGSLFLLSRQSALELKELAKLLVRRAEPAASTAAG